MATPITEAISVARLSLDEFFSASVLRSPDRPALIVGDQTWSYAELDAQCSSIERILRSACLSGTGRAVGLIYAKSAFSYAAVIAIMRSDCVYVPLNPKTPASRLLKIFDDAEVGALIVDTTDPLPEEISDALRRSPYLTLITNESQCAVAAAPVHVGSRPDPEGLAYIIYTSGSTGEPKGVAISRKSAFACMNKLHNLWQTNETDRFTQFSPLSFDYSLVELFVCWKSGAALCVPSAADTLVPFDFAVTQRITVWFSVPSLANFLLKLGLLKAAALPEIRISLLGGEALPFELAHAWATAAPSSRIFNLYGPTEVTIVSTYYEIKRSAMSRSGTVPIGIPLSGLRSAIVADDRLVEADDSLGELWLTGDQLALGYWKNPSATSAAFYRSSAGDIWYKTGDLVSNGVGIGLSYRGRVDRQVKLRGQRVELQEVEAALREVIGCSLVAVVPIRSAGGICEKIIAYCDALNADEGIIKTRCRSRIAAYMVPDRILELASFPISPHGKIDYRALAARTIS